MKRYYYALFGVIALTIGFHLYDFGLPAIWPDESSFFVTSLSMAFPPDSDLYKHALAFSWPHFGPLHVQFSPHVGAIFDTYTTIPFLYFLGIGVGTIRIYSMIVAVISIVLIYFAGKELFSSRVGIIASVLLAINPLFVFFTRQGILYEWTLVCIFLLIMILSLRYVKNLKNRNLATVLFLIPLCIFSYAWFLWYALGLLATLPLFIKGLFSKLSSQNEFAKSSQTKLYLAKKKYHLKIFYYCRNCSVCGLNSSDITICFFEKLFTSISLIENCRNW